MYLAIKTNKCLPKFVFFFFWANRLHSWASLIVKSLSASQWNDTKSNDCHFGPVPLNLLPHVLHATFLLRSIGNDMNPYATFGAMHWSAQSCRQPRYQNNLLTRDLPRLGCIHLVYCMSPKSASDNWPSPSGHGQVTYHLGLECPHYSMKVIDQLI